MVATFGHVGSCYARCYAQTSKAVGRARSDVVEFARSCGFAEQQLSDIEVAVGEGLANAFEHGFDGEGGFEVLVRRDDFALTIEIKDRGHGFDHAQLRPTRPPAEALRGFGMFIMRELMDEIRYTELGTRLHLRKALPSPDIEQRTAGQQG